MALQFRPPDAAFIESLYNRPKDTEILAGTIGNITNQELERRRQQQQMALLKQQRDMEMAKNLSEYGTNYGDILQAISPNYRSPVQPAPSQPPLYAKGPSTTATDAMPDQQTSFDMSMGVPWKDASGRIDLAKLNQHYADVGKQFGQKGVAREKEQVSQQMKLEEMGPHTYVTTADLKKRGGVLQPNERLYPSENRDWVLSKDATTGKAVLVDKLTGETKSIEGLGTGPMSEFTPNQLKVIDDTAKAYQSDDIVSGARMNLSQLDNMKKLLNSGNPAAPGPFRSIAARVIAGEKGVLTDRDVARNTGSESLGAQFKRYVQKAYDGQFSDQDKTDFNNLLDQVASTSRKRLDNVTSSYVKRASLRSGIADTERIRQMIELPANFGEDQNANQSPTVSPGTWTTDKESRYQELLKKRGGAR